MNEFVQAKNDQILINYPLYISEYDVQKIITIVKQILKEIEIKSILLDIPDIAISFLHFFKEIEDLNLTVFVHENVYKLINEMGLNISFKNFKSIKET